MKTINEKNKKEINAVIHPATGRLVATATEIAGAWGMQAGSIAHLVRLGKIRRYGIWHDLADAEAALSNRRPPGRPRKAKPGTCSRCGCTEDRACEHPDSGDACSWTDDSRTLCDACEAEKGAE